MRIRVLWFLVLITKIVFFDIQAQTTDHSARGDSSKNDTVFAITGQLEFEGKVVRNSIRKSEIDRLLDLRVKLTGNLRDEWYGMELTDPAGNRFPVSHAENGSEQRQKPRPEQPMIWVCSLTS